MSIDEKSSYYDVGGIETIEVIRAKLTPEQFAGYCLGNIMKYSTRMMHKGCAERDAEKVSVYAGLLREHVTGADAGERTADTGERQPKVGDRIRVLRACGVGRYSRGDVGVLNHRGEDSDDDSWFACFPDDRGKVMFIGHLGFDFELIGDDDE